jgi:hypothetical protein
MEKTKNNKKKPSKTSVSTFESLSFLSKNASDVPVDYFQKCVFCVVKRKKNRHKQT